VLGRARQESKILVLWALAAAAFALWRTPYDDEWFQITLARDTPWPELWASLRSDLHPPWVALLDWATVRLAGSAALPLTRVAASLLALWLLLEVVVTQTRAPARAVAIAAFHPIVFMYGGAVRWYPFLFLGQAARAWALFGPSAGSRRAQVAFALGALAGAAAGYVDLPLLALDVAWLVAMARSRGSTRTSLPTAFAAVALAGATLVASPLLSAHRALLGEGWSFAPGLAARWLGLGLAGEAFLPWPFTLLALAVLPGLAWGLAALIGSRASRPFGAWIVAVGLVWLALSGRGVGHPRYSLLFWFLVTAAAAQLFSLGRGPKLAAGATFAYLALALSLTIDQRWFLKGDLDRLPASACAALSPAPPPDLVIAPYPRTQVELTRVCAPSAKVVTAGWIGHFPWESRGEIASIREALPARGTVDLVTVPAGGSSLGTTNDHVRELLADHCRLVETRQAAPMPHLALRRGFDGGAPAFRFTLERWRCGEGGPGQ
jgi:hypothetical protein